MSGRLARVAPRLILAPSSARGRLYARVGRGRRAPPPRAHAGRRARSCDDRALLCATTSRVTAQEVGLGLAGRARRSGSCWRWRCTSRASLRRAVYPLLVGLAGRARRHRRPAARRLVRLRHPAQARDHRARLLLPDRRHDARRAGRASTPSSASCMRTLDASRWQAFRCAEAPAALPAALSGAKIAVAVAVIGAVFAEYAGSSEGLGHLSSVDPAARDRARLRGRRRPGRVRRRCSSPLLALAERRLVPWAHRRPKEPRP